MEGWSTWEVMVPGWGGGVCIFVSLCVCSLCVCPFTEWMLHNSEAIIVPQEEGREKKVRNVSKSSLGMNASPKSIDI